MGDEVEGAGGTADVEGQAAVEQTPASGATDAPNATETFADPAAIPAELQPHFKRMQAAFTRKMQALGTEKAAQAEKLASYDRLMNDAEFAKQVILEAAPRLGLSVAPAGSNGSGAGTAATGDGPPPEFVAKIQATLPDELKWMAPAQAAALWEGSRTLLQPVLEKQQQQVKATHEREFEALADSLSQRAPEWAEHEDAMGELLDFINSEALTHPVFGSKLDILYNVVTKNTAATQEAVRRMTAAGRNRTVTGRSESSTTPNLTERVKKAPSMQDAFRIASEDAQRQLGGK